MIFDGAQHRTRTHRGVYVEHRVKEGDAERRKLKGKIEAFLLS
jgi:hypothetical protein